MIDGLKSALVAASSGVRAQSARIQVISENLANATTTARVAGGDPYARKTISFVDELDRASGASVVRIAAVSRDRSPFEIRHDPEHPGADANGYVKMPNVNPLIEMSDMREAHRSYEANLQVIKQARGMIGDLIDLLRSK